MVSRAKVKKRIVYHFFQAYTPIPMLMTNNPAITRERGHIELSGIAAGDGIASVGALMVPSWTGVGVGAADGADVARGFGVDGTGLAIGADPDKSMKRSCFTL
jgi:hypothetical protein